MPSSRVLVVDDDCELADSLAELLVANGFTVSTVYDGESALQEVKSESYEQAIIDIHLPDIKGNEVANAMLREGLILNVLLMTGYTAASAEDDMKIKVLTKPVQIATLLAELERQEWKFR